MTMAGDGAGDGPPRAAGARRGPAWWRMVRDKELRIVSAPAPGDAVYAMTVVGLSGSVIVQLDRRLWLDTPRPLREARIEAHLEQVRTELHGLRRPGRILRLVALGARAAVLAAGAGAAWETWAAGPSWGTAAVLAVSATGLIPGRWLAPLFRRAVALALRRLLRAG